MEDAPVAVQEEGEKEQEVVVDINLEPDLLQARINPHCFAVLANVNQAVTCGRGSTCLVTPGWMKERLSSKQSTKRIFGTRCSMPR